MLRINLKPISVNKAWQGRRFKSKEYKGFEQDFLLELSKMDIQKTEGEYGMTLHFHMKNALASDLSNFIKTTEDIIVKAGLVDDDRFCKQMVVRKYKSPEDYFEFDIWKI